MLRGLRRLSTCPLSSSGSGNRRIIVLDDVPPESNAMLQALYSRSPESVVEHLKKVRSVGPEKFMKSYYVGYGHKSIGDCGTTTIFAENVSMLAAKAIQDWPLYNGQEASTRYLDFSKQPIVCIGANPITANKAQSDLMDFYNVVVSEMKTELKKSHPFTGDASDKKALNVYNKAIEARAFDIGRGFIPAGVTTYVSWHTNLRQAHDHLKRLRHHPLSEVRDIADDTLDELRKKYSSSFLHKTYDSEEEYFKKSAHLDYYDGVVPALVSQNDVRTYHCTSEINIDVPNCKELLSERPPKAELHPRFRECGNLTFRFLLDFGSYRDLQRHRSVVQPLSLLSTKNGFEPWYLDQLTPRLRDQATHLLNTHQWMMESEKEAGLSSVNAQYLIPMGFRVPVKMVCNLPSAVYISELRSASTVHPTLRNIALKMSKSIKAAAPGIALHPDNSLDEWSLKRGHQDISLVQAKN